MTLHHNINWKDILRKHFVNQVDLVKFKGTLTN